ncbi:helix-turn-helix domain-containing protein [Cellulomonas cellasea]|uniref:AcrR family transcriptional regulator n=1 Tax=Cellulomonas cellasea TaxID=43670 RepID=A0A7W4Y9L3_9CELL|nr:helix-turn-helix domain-containing protein [Cellulomonas cellasea]MBB2921713.1 AcrR family transcriptional regulator [Cellulomonas cellasea]
MAPAPAKGRPRVGVSAHPDLPAPEQILRAAAQLFVDCGYDATSTRAIAAAVGIRQASLYYHFASKADILAELLSRTVTPSLDAAERLLADVDDPAVRLHELVTVDCRLLLDAPANVGALYLLPEVRAERFADFRAQRARLRDAYGALVERAAAPGAALGPLDVLTDVVFGLVESVIGVRGREAGGAEMDGTEGDGTERDGGGAAGGARPVLDSGVLVTTVARSALRVLGWDEDGLVRIERASDARRPA